MERAKSHHRFSYSQLLAKGVGDINHLINTALHPDSRLSYLHVLAKQALKEYKTFHSNNAIVDQLIVSRSGINRSNHAMNALLEYSKSIWTVTIPGIRMDDAITQSAANVLLYSVYFHLIYIWDEELDPNRVYVIEGERITSFRSAKRLAKDKISDSELRNKSTIDRGLPYTRFVMNKTLEEELAGIFG